mmetsp:Transcript_18658/g.27352  ORF Transcript_18658/g.27352 Transcript_18658/m.27352 type:complete len:348 (+) Transcript_18658:475-1518(+)
MSFSASGHALTSLLVSYLVVSKVFLALGRYMEARTCVGNAFGVLRDLHQLSLIVSESRVDEQACQWREEMQNHIINLLKSAIRVVRDEEKAIYLAAAVLPATDDDPHIYAQILRTHLYNKSTQMLHPNLEYIEKSKMLDLLQAFISYYRELLKLASTPLPFPLIQMGRTFLFLFTFSFPFALVGLVDDIAATIIFVFFLTYGFMGLEFTAMKLLHPFGDSVNDLNVIGMGQATIRGMMRDTVCLKKRIDFQKSSGNTGNGEGCNDGNESKSEIAIVINNEISFDKYSIEYAKSEEIEAPYNPYGEKKRDSSRSFGTYTRDSFRGWGGGKGKPPTYPKDTPPPEYEMF